MSKANSRPRLPTERMANYWARMRAVVICPLTTTIRADADQFRLNVSPSAQNGLRVIFQLTIDKLTVLPVAKIGQIIGSADDALLLRVNRTLALFLGIV